MKNLPKIFNTKQDVLNCLQLDKEKTIRQLQALYNNRFVWEKIKTLAEEEKEINDALHKTEYVSTSEGRVKTLFEKIEDSNAYIFSVLNFSKKELKKIGVK